MKLYLDKKNYNIKGDYYIFGINIEGEVGGDMTLYVEKDTYEVSEYSTDGYFGKYRSPEYFEEQHQKEQASSKTYSKDEISQLLIKRQYGTDAYPFDDEEYYVDGELAYMMETEVRIREDHARWDQIYVGTKSLNVYNYDKELIGNLK